MTVHGSRRHYCPYARRPSIRTTSMVLSTSWNRPVNPFWPASVYPAQARLEAPESADDSIPTRPTTARVSRPGTLKRTVFGSIWRTTRGAEGHHRQPTQDSAFRIPQTAARAHPVYPPMIVCTQPGQPDPPWGAFNVRTICTWRRPNPAFAHTCRRRLWAFQARMSIILSTGRRQAQVSSMSSTL